MAQAGVKKGFHKGASCPKTPLKHLKTGKKRSKMTGTGHVILIAVIQFIIVFSAGNEEVALRN
jgi:hypothetical protein